MKAASFANRRSNTKEMPFLSVYQMVRVWTSGGSLSVKEFVEYPPGFLITEIKRWPKSCKQASLPIDGMSAPVPSQTSYFAGKRKV